MTTLSIILISKNQAWNMPRLIESVLEKTKCVPSREVILVDSASTDKTVEAAQAYPISIIRLRAEQQLTPAAGRYIGCKYTKGDLILFLDGDMELCQGWLEKALQFLQDRPDVAMVTGQVIDLPKVAGPDDKPPLPSPADEETNSITEIPYSGGAAMYRRSVLETVGPFNPYLYSDEEPELCIRLRHAGYRLFRIQYPMAYHYSDPAGAFSTLVGRWRRKLYLGAGQNLRYHFGRELFWPYFKERGYGLIPGLGLGAGLLSFLWFWKSGQKIWFVLWLLALAAVIVGDSYRKRSLYRTMASLLERILILDGSIRGFLLPPLAPDTYPDRLDVIKLENQPG